ncbi:MAG: hypothetical protein AAGK01_03950 [Pseudomonadota bacterium]
MTLAACAPQGQAQDQEGTAQTATAVNSEISGIQSAEVGGTALTLANDGMTCDVTFGDAFVSLDLPPPCRFLGTDGAIDAVVHDYAENGAVVLVGGPLVALSDYERFFGRTPEQLCSYIAQPVIVKDGEVAVGEMVAGSQGLCGLAAPDEKFYYSLVHPQP